MLILIKSYVTQTNSGHGNLKMQNLQILYYICLTNNHRHLSNVDCLMARTAFFVYFINIVNGRSNKKEAFEDQR
jgi:hypothetical protein